MEDRLRGDAVSDKNIRSILTEERLFEPPADFAARARVKSADLAELRSRAAADPFLQAESEWNAQLREAVKKRDEFVGPSCRLR